jgi:hypothetical protein
METDCKQISVGLLKAVVVVSCVVVGSLYNLSLVGVAEGAAAVVFAGE